MPVDYIAGKMMIVRSMVNGMDLYPIEPKSMPDLQGFINIDFCAMVPLQVLNLLTCKNDLEPIKKLIIGGAEINNELEKLVLPIKTEVYASYGMAETSSHIALRRLNGPSPQNEYIALPGVHLSTDERSCLIINAPFLPSTVYSNDIVQLTSPRSFKWLGRYDNLINSGGIKIVPEEVESIIYSKTQLICIAIGLPDKKLGQKLVLVFEKDQNPDSLLSLSSDFENLLPRHWRPKDMIIVKHFPRNNSLKVDRKKLVQEISNKYKLK
jgi:O-succinylbenzoic acid--CoA ligase